MTNYKWTPALQTKYDAIYSYLKKTLKLDVNKDDYVETISNRQLFHYILDNDKWSDSTKENYMFAIARKLNILKKKRYAKIFTDKAVELKTIREELEGQNGLDAKELANWKPHEFFVNLIDTLKQDGNITITQHLKILLLTLLTYQPPLRTSFYTTALLIREKKANDKNHNYVYINRRGNSKVQYIVNKDKASNYKLYNINKNLSFIDVEGEAKKAIIESYENFPRNYLLEIDGRPITDSTLLRWLRDITGVDGLTIDIMRSSYITWFYETHPHYNDRDKLSRLMRHSQKTAQLNYQKVFTTEQKEDDCRETRKTLIELQQELKRLNIQLDAYKQNKPDEQNFKKRRRDVIYNLNTKGRSPRDDTLKKYNIIFNSSTNKYE